MPSRDPAFLSERQELAGGEVDLQWCTAEPHSVLQGALDLETDLQSYPRLNIGAGPVCPALIIIDHRPCQGGVTLGRAAPSS